LNIQIQLKGRDRGDQGGQEEAGKRGGHPAKDDDTHGVDRGDRLKVEINAYERKTTLFFKCISEKCLSILYEDVKLIRLRNNRWMNSS